LPTDLPPRRQGFFGLLISHHPPEQLHLCYRIRLGRRYLHFCARCSGLFPAMFLTLLIGRLTGPWPEWLAWFLLFIPPLPALMDWGTATAAGRAERANWIRMVTGIGLGTGFGASLHVNTYDLLGRPVMAQFVFLLTSVWVVWMVSYSRRSRMRREKVQERMRNRPTLEQFVRQSMEQAGQDASSEEGQENKPQVK
jgi:uncharacterized membrane protein